MKSGVWAAKDHRIIEDAVAQWHHAAPQGLWQAEGGHFEHLL